MPMAKKKPNTVARLAMGTAILTVISGCDNRIGQNISTAVAPMATAVANAPVTVIETLSPSTTAVIEPEYVVPGAPTYRETSRAANVQTFESVYGSPVAAAPSDAMAAGQTYAVPSYDDGAVTVQTLAAPTSVTSYTQQVTAAIAPVYDTMPDSAAGFVYGDTLTSEAYTVIPEPVMATPMAAMPAPAAPAPIMYESETVFGQMAEPAPFDPFMDAPMAPVPAPVETYSIDSLPTYTTEPVVTEPAIMPMTEGEAFPQTYETYEETLPMTDASADMMPAASSGFVVMSEPVAFEAGMDSLPAMAEPAPYAAAPFEAAPSYGGMQIIGNDEAATTYGVAPVTGISGDRSEGVIPAAVTDIFATSSYAPAMAAPVEMAPVEMAALVTTPVPSRKQARSAAPEVVAAPVTAAPVAYSPLTAPVPRRRPSRADAGYATLTTPLPQPRPAYDNPVANATSAGSYVSIGALPGRNEANVMRSMESEAPAARDEIEVAAIAAPTLERPVKAEPGASELSGTSWRLVEIDDTPVSVNTELHFDGSSGFAGGQGPCNSYGGEFRNVGAGQFSMANIFSTDTSCASIDVEVRYLEALKKADAYEIAPGFAGMSLLDGGGQEIARFKAF